MQKMSSYYKEGIKKIRLLISDAKEELIIQRRAVKILKEAVDIPFEDKDEVADYVDSQMNTRILNIEEESTSHELLADTVCDLINMIADEKDLEWKD